MTDPTLREALDRVVSDTRGAVHTSFPARVLAYDAGAQTVDLRPALQREVPSDDPAVQWGFDTMPDLLAVQVMWPRAGGFAITFPIQVGDWVLVLCAEQSTLLWRSKGTAGTHPGMSDPHGLNGCVALPGWFPDAQKLSNVSTTDLVIGSTEDDTTIRIKPGGTVHLGSDSGDDFVALASKVEAEIAKLQLAFDLHVHLSAAPGTPTGPVVPVEPLPTPLPPGLVGSVAATKVRAR